MQGLKPILLMAALFASSGIARAQSTAPTPGSPPNHNAIHVVGGFGMSSTVGIIGERPWLGLVSTLAAGVAKEAHDHYTRREPGWSSVRDSAYISAGAVAGYFIARHAAARRKRAARERRSPAQSDPPAERSSTGLKEAQAPHTQ